jgi:hypothetical protein
MPAFKANTDQMTSVAARLTSVVNMLTSETHSGFDTAALGHGDAISALESFVSNWSHGRSEIATGVTTAHENLVGSAGNYTTVENAEKTAFAKAAASIE